tara:strand:- start:5943 stop:6413 length:471 start_codon:yes stop_codon:yes gene_type:complete
MKKGLSTFRPQYIKEMKQRVHTTQDAYIDQSDTFKKKYTKKKFIDISSCVFEETKKLLLEKGTKLHIPKIGTLVITKKKESPRNYNSPHKGDYRLHKNLHTDGYVGKMVYSTFYMAPANQKNRKKWRCYPTRSMRNEMRDQFLSHGLDRYINLTKT